MKTQAHILLEESFGVPPEMLFAALADHEGMTLWPLAQTSAAQHSKLEKMVPQV